MKKRQALVVGINDYLFQHELRTPANDANAVAQKLMELGFEVTGLPSASTQEAWRVHQEKELLTHELEGAITKLFALNANVSIPETALLFFAGHGLRKEIGNFSKGFLATSRVDRKESWGFPLKELREILEKSPVKQQIVILDCCYAGELLNFDEADPGDGETISRCFIAACREFEPAYEPTTGEHSILTEALLQGLQQEGFISNITICQWIETALKTRNQTPICRKWGEIVLRDPGLELPEDPPDDCPCPYKGLEAFQEEDAKYFFGREKLTQTLVNRLRDSQLLAVLGISGSGKSSVVRAGLIPNLKQGKTLSESKTWKICAPFTPGDDPLASLAQVLVNEKLCTSEQATQELAKGAKGLHRLISPANAPCVFVVDQFEQVFTPSQDPAKRKQFFDCLLGATDSDSLRDKGGWGRSATSPLRVIITMRADFLGKCAEYPQLAKLIETHQAIVTEMKEAELREAIGKPAKKVNWNIPPDLENLMVADVQKSPGSLPLLQDILKQLWHRRSQRLTVQTYQDMGGVQKALQNRANKVYYQTLSSEQQAIARSIFLKLTQLLENSKPIARQVRKSELTDLPYPPEEVETVLEKLEAARLIVTSELEARGNPEEKIIVVDVAHESLISNWKQLERWVKENFDAKRQEEDIQKKTRDWADKGKRREGLLRGLDLAEVELFEREHSQTFPLSPLAREFVRKSIRQRRNSRLLGIGAVVTVFSVVTGLWLNAQRQATIANLRANAAQAQHLLSTPQPLEGLVLAIQATGESQGQLRRVMSSAQSSLLTGIQTTREQNRLRGHQGGVNAVAISPDGETIVSGSWDDTLRLWNRQGEQLAVLRGHQSSVTAVAISPDGETIVSGSWDDTLRLWNRQGEQLAVLRGHQDWVNAVAISPDGETIVSGSRDRTLRLWNRQGEQLAVLRGHQSSVRAVAISPDGETIVSGSLDDTLRLWNRQGEQLAVLRGHQSSVNTVAISPDGETLVSGSGDNTLRLWNRQGEQLAVLRGHQSSVYAVAISPDGETIVSGSSDDTLRLWRLGNWTNWLQIVCNQLKYHPVLVAPETDVARDAGETCQNHAWTPSESAQFLVNQGKSLARAEDIEGAVAKFNQANKLDATLDLDPEAEAKQIAVPALIEAGNDLAYQGDYHEAVAKFQQALTLDPTLDLDPEAEAKQIAVPVLLARGEQQVEDQDYQAAVEAYTAAQTIDATLDISADTWNEICWFGSLRGEPEAVMPACEQAVTLEPEEAAHRGNLGLAKALTGETEGAIQEFQAFIELSNNAGANRLVQGYINTLRAGDNPFTEAEIQRLLGEESNPVPSSRY